jgi:hypothetical protein
MCSCCCCRKDEGISITVDKKDECTLYEGYSLTVHKKFNVTTGGITAGEFRVPIYLKNNKGKLEIETGV